MSGEEELQLIEAAAFRHAVRRGLSRSKAERISERTALFCKDGVEFAADMERIAERHGS